MRWKGDSVDVYAIEIRRLAGLAGFKKVGLDHIVRMAFVNGFPEAINVELQQMCASECKPLSDLIARARILAANKASTVSASAMGGSHRQAKEGQSFYKQNNDKPLFK